MFDIDDDLMDEISQDLRWDRLSSEFCGWCNTRHHPDSECQEDFDEEV